MNENDMSLGPVWCHHCGTYSDASAWGADGDTCPACGEVYPPSDGPLQDEPIERRAEAADLHEVVW